jgi:ABC-type cobalt transport system substrate-binding protein
MNEIEKKSVPRKGIVVALGISCIILVACLAVAIETYTLAINDKNSQISQLNSDYNSMFQLLFSHFSNLQNHQPQS